MKVKYFRFNDEPAHRALTEEEVTQIQEKLLSDKSAIGLMSSEDLKHKESQMEGNSFKIVLILYYNKLADIFLRKKTMRKKSKASSMRWWSLYLGTSLRVRQNIAH